MEGLQAIRDVYREHLEALECRPLGQMFWVVFRFGVMDWGLRLLRSAVRDYVALFAVNRKDWEELFGPLMLVPLGEEERFVSEHEIFQDGAELEAGISRQLRKDCFDQVTTGGPFGHGRLIGLAEETLSLAMARGESLPDILKRRE